MIDFPRIALYGLLALIGVTLVNAWQHDYGVVAVAPATTNAVVSSPLVNNPAVSQATPATAPQVPLVTSPTTKPIEVTTDVLNVKISPQDGSIVGVSLTKYPQNLQSKTPFTLLTDQPETFYLAQSGFKANAGQPILYHSDQNQYQLGANEKQLAVTLVGKNAQGLVSKKTYTFQPNSYVITETDEIDNKTAQPITGQFYHQLIRKNVVQPSAGLFRMQPFLGAAYSTNAQPYQKLTFKKMSEQNLQVSTPTGWIAMLEHYFLSAWIPPQNAQFNVFTATQNDFYTVGIQSTPVTLAPGQQSQSSAQLYAGPLITQDLKMLAPNLDLTVDYGWLWMISDAIFWLLKAIHTVVGNWGWAIVLVTVIIKLVFYKLSAKSYQSMSAMRALQPKLNSLRERYGDDKQKLSRATMELYKKEKINPLGGCLPMVVQIPVFLALYWVLFESVELRQAPFILWIHDLSAPDPYYVLPILMGISMFIQQKLSPPPPDPAQAKVMLIMPLVLTLFFLNFPAGLVLYWFVNNTLSILQQWYIMKTYTPAPVRKK